jgi:predicted enzyme related to lactoylglutathione lyase
MTAQTTNLFVRLAPVLHVGDLAAERAFYERLGLPITYEGEEYPDFIAFGAGAAEFGIQQSPVPNDPQSVLTWQILVSDLDAMLERCRNAGLVCQVEENNPAPGWSYRRIILETPSGYRLALEGPNEAGRIGAPDGE